MDQNELDIVRRALLKYTGNDAPGVGYPPHGAECSRWLWTVPIGSRKCSCGVQEIIDNWKPTPPEEEYPGRCLKCQKPVRWDRLTNEEGPYGPHYLFDDAGRALCPAYDGRVHHSVAEDFPPKP